MSTVSPSLRVYIFTLCFYTDDNLQKKKTADHQRSVLLGEIYGDKEVEMYFKKVSKGGLIFGVEENGYDETVKT